MNGIADEHVSIAAPQVLLAARWALLAALAILTLVQGAFPMLLGPQLGGPWSTLLLVIAGALVNAHASRNKASWSVRRPGAHLLLDVAGLTCFLGLSGAAANPFTMLYFVPIGLATLLPSRTTWLVAGAALVGFAVLLLVTNVTQGLAGHFLHHVVGMWLGLAISGGTITFFVHRLAAALARQRSELERTARAALEAQHLASLGALAAGAAHELGTPLGTIQLLVDELDKMDASERSSAIQNMRGEVSRCKSIVHDMATPELSAKQLERSEPWPLTRLMDRYRKPRDSDVQPGGSEYPLADVVPPLEDGEVSVELTPRARGQQSTQPRLIIQRTLDELVKNGLEACRAASLPPRVGVRAEVSGDAATIVVEDRGPGLNPKLRESAFAAFSTTNESGRGLGLFLARAHLHQLGGTLELADHDGDGARFVMRFPLSGRALTRAAVKE